MADLQQVMTALKNADAAGDTAAATRLAEIARGMIGKTADVPRGPQGEDLTTGPMNPPPLPVDAPAGYLPPSQGQTQNRAGDVTMEMIKGPVAGFKAFGSGLIGTGESPSRKYLESEKAWPLNQAPGWQKTALSKVGDAGGALLSGAGAVISGGAGLVGEMVGSGTNNERKLARDLIGMAEVSAPELSGVSSTALAAGKAATATQRFAGKPVTAAERAARAADDLGVTPSLGMTGKTGAMAAAGLEKVPLAGSVIAKDAARAVGEVEGAFAKIRSGIGQALSPESAGGVLQSGARAAVEKFKERSSALFAKVDERMPKGTRVKIDNAQSAVSEMKQYFDGNPELAKKLGLNQWDAIMKEADANGLSWQALKNFRTKIGEAIGTNRGALADEDLGRLKSLYGALTEDMEAATKAAGNGAYGAWKAANNHYKSGATRIERSLDATITAKSPERAFEAFDALTKADRSTSDLTRMREIKQALSDEDWNTVSASIVDRLGKARAGAQGADGNTFSPGTFLTEWNKLSPDAKRILLPEQSRIELEKLAAISERVKSANLERNTSNTGTTVGLMAAGAGGVTNLPATVAALGAANVSARFMTSPITLRALNSLARGDAKAMKAMAGGKGPFARDAQTILTIAGAEISASANANENPLRAVNQR